MKKLKYLVLLLCYFTYSKNACSQLPEQDPGAIYLLDRMSSVIGELNSCTFDVQISRDEYDQNLNLITKHFSHSVLLEEPDKMVVQSTGQGLNRSLWYDGEEFVFYSLKQNNYSSIPKEGNIIDAIDYLNSNYGIEFPAADLLYPSFTDDLMDEFNTIHFLGKVSISGSEYFHI